MIIELNVKLGIFDAGVKLRFRSNDESIILGAIHYKELRKYELVVAEKEIVRAHSVSFKAIQSEIHTKDLFSTLFG